MQDDLEALAARVEARPSLFMTSMLAMAVFFISTLALHVLTDWTSWAPWAEKHIKDLGVAATLLTWWQVRYEPVARLADALRARKETQ